jgi:hypothetical protein
MKELGCAITVVCLIFALIFVWLGYVTTFEADGPIFGMESTPKEGWEYWIEKKFWSDFWTFSLWLSFAIASVVLPLIATVRSRCLITERRTADKILVGITGLYTILVMIVTVSCLKANRLWSFLPLPLLLGGLYSFGISLLRLRHPHSGPYERLD